MPVEAGDLMREPEILITTAENGALVIIIDEAVERAIREWSWEARVRPRVDVQLSPERRAALQPLLSELLAEFTYIVAMAMDGRGM